MSGRHRYTHRAGRREDARHTVRAPRFIQSGGGSTLQFISDPGRAAKWDTALSEHAELNEFAGVITQPNWGTTHNDTKKLEMYVRLIERQDLMMQTALRIIYKEFSIDPTADDLEDKVLAKLPEIQSNEVSMKEYFKDVYRIVTLTEPDLSLGTGSGIKRFVTKLARLNADPLSNILLWPARVNNMVVSGCADVLVSLKEDSAILEKSKNSDAMQIMFADLQNTFIIQETYEFTSKGLRDGCNMWQTVGDSVMPEDECATSKANCIGDTKAMIWSNFCKAYKDATNIFDSATKDLTKYLYSRILADIFKLYKEESATADSVRAALIAKFNPTQSLVLDSRLRPSIAGSVSSPLAGMVRALTPEQYHFAFHLLYTMKQKEAAAAASGSELSS